MHELQCGEIWGGNVWIREAFSSPGLSGVIASSSSDGECGGDVYYLSQCDAGHVTRFAVADVVGHGEAVCQVSDWFYDSLKARMNSQNGQEVLEDVNRVVCARGIRAMTTSVVASYYRESGDLTVSSAGHPPMLISRSGGQWQELIQNPANGNPKSGLPLGIDPVASYTQSVEHIGPGDRLFVYTDGLIESRNTDGQQFSRSRLLAALNELRDAPLSLLAFAVLDAVRNHVGRRRPQDDSTLLCIEITSAF